MPEISHLKCRKSVVYDPRTMMPESQLRTLTTRNNSVKQVIKGGTGGGIGGVMSPLASQTTKHISMKALAVQRCQDFTDTQQQSKRMSS